MSQSLNTLVLHGNLTADPKLTDRGAVVFTVAHTRSRKLYGWGWTEWERKTSYLPCIVFQEDLQEAILTRAKEGSAVVVQGRIETFASSESRYHDRFSVVVDDVTFGERCEPRRTAA